MSVLILSCSTGGGHNACSRALQEIFGEKGIPCIQADALRFISPSFARFVSWGHTTMYREIPGLMKNGYDYLENHPDAAADGSALTKILVSGGKKLRRFLIEQKVDRVVTTHPFAAYMLSAMQEEKPLPIGTAFVATDYTCCPLVQSSKTDLVFIPAPSLTPEFVCENIPQDKIVASGIPIEQRFHRKNPKEQAKTHFGLAGERKHLLIMSGSMGCGPVEQIIPLLAGNYDLSVVCGTNEALYERLQRQYRKDDRIHLYGFTREVDLLLDSADLLLTKPGGLSTTEAAAKKVPMVLLDTVGACETYNLNFFVNAGGAVAAETPEAVAEIIEGLLFDEAKLQEMKQALYTLNLPNGAKVIANCI